MNPYPENTRNWQKGLHSELLLQIGTISCLIMSQNTHKKSSMCTLKFKPGSRRKQEPKTAAAWREPGASHIAQGRGRLDKPWQHQGEQTLWRKPDAGPKEKEITSRTQKEQATSALGAGGTPQQDLGGLPQYQKQLSFISGLLPSKKKAQDKLRYTWLMQSYIRASQRIRHHFLPITQQNTTAVDKLAAHCLYKGRSPCTQKQKINLWYEETQRKSICQMVPRASLEDSQIRSLTMGSLWFLQAMEIVVNNVPAEIKKNAAIKN